MIDLQRSSERVSTRLSQSCLCRGIEMPTVFILHSIMDPDLTIGQHSPEPVTVLLRDKMQIYAPGESEGIEPKVSLLGSLA